MLTILFFSLSMTPLMNSKNYTLTGIQNFFCCHGIPEPPKWTAAARLWRRCPHLMMAQAGSSFPSHFLSLTVLTLIPLAVVANDLVPWYPMNPQAWSTRAPAATAVMREVAGEQIDLSSLHLEYISHLGSVG